MLHGFEGQQRHVRAVNKRRRIKKGRKKTLHKRQRFLLAGSD
jgi:hypothetical protein